MPTYLVLKRIKEDWVSLPGELLVDPSNASLLIKRGYLVPVPDNYPGAVSQPPQQVSLPTVEEESLPASVADSPPPSSESKAPEIVESDDLERLLEHELEQEMESKPKSVPTKRARPVARVTHRR